jgi:seryl-tRNA synthetase
MTLRNWLESGLAAGLLLLTVSMCIAWRETRNDWQGLQSDLKASQAALTDASKRQQDRDASLKQVVADLTKQKAAVQTPAEVVKALPAVLPLPEPLVIDTAVRSQASETASGDRAKSKADKNSPRIELPAGDLKPLYDLAVDCKACKVNLATAQADLKDEQLKTRAVTQERDAALKIAHGGSVVRRVVRAAKWFAVGAALGAAAAAKLAH